MSICTNCIHKNVCDYESRYREECSQFLEERPHGEWIKTGRTNIYDGFEIECSHCHNKLMVSPKRWEVGENFCDVCGSQNKEVKRNE